MNVLRAALALGAVGVVSAVACSFPTIGYRDASGGGTTSTHTSTTSSTSSSTSGKTTSSSTHTSSSGTGGAGTGGAGMGGAGPGGAKPDGGGGMGGAGSGGAGGSATSSSSSSSSSSGAGGGCLPTDIGKDPCDCDADGDKTPACGGGDCNDHDPLVKSTQMGWFDTPGSNGWDYNCDGQNEYQYPDTLGCNSLLTCDTSTQDWSGGSTPDCGQMGPYATCAYSTSWPFCKDGSNLGTRKQGCH